MICQKNTVLIHLKQYGTISSWEAITNYHITRLSEYIRALRNDDGLKITDQWFKRDGKRWKVYKLEEDSCQNFTQ